MVALVSLTLFDVQSYVLDVSDSSRIVLSGNYIMKSFYSQTVGMGTRSPESWVSQLGYESSEYKASMKRCYVTLKGKYYRVFDIFC